MILKSQAPIGQILVFFGQNGTYFFECVIFIDVPLNSPARINTFRHQKHALPSIDPILAP